MTAQGWTNQYRVVNHYGEACDDLDEVGEWRDLAEDRAAYLDRIHDGARCGVHYVQTRQVTAWTQLELPLDPDPHAAERAWEERTRRLNQ